MKSKKFIISSAIAVTILAGGTTYALIDRGNNEDANPKTVAQETVKNDTLDKEVATQTKVEVKEEAPMVQESDEPVVVVDNTEYIAGKLASVNASAMTDKFNTILSMQNPSYLTADKAFIDDVFAVSINPDFSFIGRGQMTGQINTCINSNQPVLCINATHHYLHFAGSPKLDDLR